MQRSRMRELALHSRYDCLRRGPKSEMTGRAVLTSGSRAAEVVMVGADVGGSWVGFAASTAGDERETGRAGLGSSSSFLIFFGAGTSGWMAPAGGGAAASGEGS